MTTTPHRDIAALDVPADTVAAEALLLAGRTAEQRHQLDNYDRVFARMACDHPEACSCPADYPDWRPGGAA